MTELLGLRLVLYTTSASAVPLHSQKSEGASKLSKFANVDGGGGGKCPLKEGAGLTCCGRNGALWGHHHVHLHLSLSLSQHPKIRGLSKNSSANMHTG